MGDGCECVPLVLMQMVMTQQEVMGRSLDRASEDTFEDEKIKVGKKTCTCDFTFTVANNGKARGTGSCDKKCSGNVKETTLNSATYSYTFGFSVKKGKVKMGKVEAVGGSTGFTTEMPGGSGVPGGSGSGMPGGGYGHSGCVCVHMPDWAEGSGMPPMPGSGSGSGTGGSGSGGNGTGARYNFLGGLSYSWDSSNSPFCAGTLVSSRWVITSASCSYADSSVVSPDTVNVLMGLTPVSVDKVIVHSGYSQSGDENNIALWRLAQASKESPLCLPAQGSQQTGTARLVGWRINPLSGYLNEELGEIEVALVEDCGQSGRICSTSSTTQCGGDFGGPLVQGSDTLIGATVSDSGCGGTGGKGLFTQISEHTDWIKRTISGNGGGDVCTNR